MDVRICTLENKKEGYLGEPGLALRGRGLAGAEGMQSHLPVAARVPREELADGFDGARSFNQPLNNWGVSNVTNMSYMFHDMFQNCEDFNQPLNNWNVSNVEDMENMFQNARSFNQPLHAP